MVSSRGDEGVLVLDWGGGIGAALLDTRKNTEKNKPFVYKTKMGVGVGKMPLKVFYVFDPGCNI